METCKDGSQETPYKACLHNKWRAILAQVFACSSKYLIMLDIGMGISFSTIAVAPLLSGKDGLHLTENEISWFAALVFVWQPVGSLATVPLSGFGRKRSMFYLQIPLFIGWLLPFFANTVWQLYLASSVMGLGIGFMQAPIATYIGEVCEPKYRGFLAAIAYCCLTLGSVCVYAIDVIVSNWRETALYCAILPPLTAVVLYIIPESPIWLVSKGRYDEGKKALMWLRGWASEAEVEEEYKLMVVNNSNQAQEASDEKSQMREVERRVEEISSLKYWSLPEMYKPFLMSLVFFLLSNGIGVAVFRSYLVLIFQGFKVEMNEYVVTVGVTTIGMLGNVLCVVTMPWVGKRVITFTGIIGSIIGVLGLAIYATFMPNGQSTWIPIVLMVELFFFTNLGVGHIPWILISEIFPLRGRTLATGLLAGIANFLQFLGTKLFLWFVSILTLGGVFFMYGLIFLVGLVCLFKFQVETEGKSLDDIVTHFRGTKRSHLPP